jgi:xanthine dehydrogenase molybdopterin-binding subunit B
VQGLGMMLSEDVKVDSATGRLLSDSTWTYKIPGAGAA